MHSILQALLISAAVTVASGAILVMASAVTVVDIVNHTSGVVTIQ